MTNDLYSTHHSPVSRFTFHLKILTTHYSPHQRRQSGPEFGRFNLLF
jgi:hypothetical protein